MFLDFVQFPESTRIWGDLGGSRRVEDTETCRVTRCISHGTAGTECRKRLVLTHERIRANGSRKAFPDVEYFRTKNCHSEKLRTVRCHTLRDFFSVPEPHRSTQIQRPLSAESRPSRSGRSTLKPTLTNPDRCRLSHPGAQELLEATKRLRRGTRGKHRSGTARFWGKPWWGKPCLVYQHHGHAT